MSRVYNIYNGFMLGQFLQTMTQEFVSIEFARHRCMEFLGEVDISVDLPQTAEGLQDFAAGLQDLQLTLFNKSPELGHACFIGIVSANLFMLRSIGDDSSPVDFDDVERITGVDGLACWARELANGITATGSANEVFGASLQLLRRLIGPLPHEPSTCFVSFPLSPVKFVSRYDSFYAPAVRQAGYVPLRAWGELTSELYAFLMIDVLSKCGTALADLSGSDPNVLYEIGIAHGQGKNVVFVVEDGSSATPSSVSDFAMTSYNTDADDWVEGALNEVRMPSAEMAVA